MNLIKDLGIFDTDQKIKKKIMKTFQNFPKQTKKVKISII